MANNELDFHDDAGVLSEIDNFLGQEVTQDQQAAQADDQAADDDTQGPPDVAAAALAHPPAAGGVRLAPPPVPQGAGALPPNLTPQQPAGPGQPGAPASDLVPGQPPAAPVETAQNFPQQTMGAPQQMSGGPAPAQPPVDAPSLSPRGTAQAAAQDSTDEKKLVANAEQLQEQGKIDEAKAQQEYNTAIKPQLDEQQVVAWQSEQAIASAKEQLDRQDKVNAAETNEQIAGLKKGLDENPRAWWSNHSTGAKIAAVISMVGAALAGKSAAGAFQNLVDQDLASYNKKMDLREKILQYNDRRGQQNQRSFQSRILADNLRTAASYKRIGEEIQVKANQSANPLVKARLMQTLGEIQTKYADKVAEINNRKNVQVAQAAQLQLGYARLQQDQEQALLAAGKNIDKNLTQIGDYQAPITKAFGLEVFKKHNDYSRAIGGLGELQDAFKQFNGINLATTAQRVQVAQAVLFPLFRKITESGANLGPSEEKSMNALIGGWKDWAAGTVSGADINARTNQVMRALAHQDRDLVLNATPDRHNEPRPESNVGRVLAQEAQDQGGQQQQALEVKEALSQATNPSQQRAKLMLLAKEGNQVAGEVLQHFDKSRLNVLRGRAE